MLLLICLAACGTKTVTKTEHVYVTPPPAYLQTYDLPELQGNQNRHLLGLILDQKEIIKMQNENVRALRYWRKLVEKRKKQEDKNWILDVLY